MRIRIPNSISALIALFLLTWIAVFPTSVSMVGQADAASQEGLILAFGDSLTAGLGVARNKTYPAILSRRLLDAGLHYEVVNAGVSGETTAGGVRRLNWVLSRYQPEIVILELGANDGLRGLGLQQMEKNLANMIERFQDEGITVILAGMKVPPNYGRSYTEGFEQTFVSLAERYELALIPFFLDGVAANPKLNQRDGLHPTAQGYEVVVDRIFPIVSAVIKGSSD